MMVNTGINYIYTTCTNAYISVLNFTHRIDELSFGQLYPTLINPLDNSVEIAETRKFYRQ